MPPKILAVIPARYASSRFPGKPLAKIDGKPMIQWVCESASHCSAFDRVIVATDDVRIAQVVDAFGGNAEMTSCELETGTDRVAEISKRYPEFDVVANVQGDQPFVTAEALERLVSPYSDRPISEWPEMSTVASPLAKECFDDPNVVKVVCDQRMQAIYFSRSPIPYFRADVEVPVFHHLGLYAFTAEFLLKYGSLESTPLERAEGLEQLRVIENGYAISVTQIASTLQEVNVPADLQLANALVGA